MYPEILIGDVLFTVGDPAGGAIQLSEIADGTGSTGLPGQYLGRDASGLFWSFPSASVWTEVSGVIKPSGAGSIVEIPVAAGVEGLRVKDAASDTQTAIAPGEVNLIADSATAAVATINAQDEAANPVPLVLNTSVLQINGPTGIRIQDTGLPSIESNDTLFINVTDPAAQVGIQTNSLLRLLVGSDDGSGQPFVNTQPGVNLTLQGDVLIKAFPGSATAFQIQDPSDNAILTVDSLSICSAWA